MSADLKMVARNRPLLSILGIQDDFRKFFLMLCYSFSPNFNEIRQYSADLCFVVNQFSFLLRRKVSGTKMSISDVHPSSKNVQITSLYMESLIPPAF